MNQTEKNQIAAALYDAWVERNKDVPGFNPDKPTPEQEAELAAATFNAMPEIVGKEWAEYVNNLTDEERQALLDSPLYNGSIKL